MEKVALKNALLVNEDHVWEGDLLIEGDRISQIGGTASASTEIDVDGAWVIPGMIDDQVHFREPGFETKACIHTESRAAVAGGVTSYMEMPNCDPQTVTYEAVADKKLRAAKDSLANYAFYLGATNDNVETIKGVNPKDVCGVKVFMGASTGNMLVDNEETLHQIFQHAPVLIATHCEHTPTILENERLAQEKYGDDIPPLEFVNIRSREACLKSSSLAVELANEHDARLHILHLTTADEMDLFQEGDVSNKKITAEVCVHHLHFNDSWYASKGTDIKCNPCIKTRADQLALIQAVVSDRIDVIATDHAPHTSAEKASPFFDAPSGMPLVQHALLSLIEHVRLGEIPIETVVKKTSHAPAELFNVSERGFLREGYFADIAVIDPKQHTTVNEEPIHAKCGWSPFRDLTFQSRVTHTFVNGKLVFSDGIVDADSRGMPLAFDR